MKYRAHQPLTRSSLSGFEMEVASLSQNDLALPCKSRKRLSYLHNFKLQSFRQPMILENKVSQ
jgi:hypothetical protein